MKLIASVLLPLSFLLLVNPAYCQVQSKSDYVPIFVNEHDSTTLTYNLLDSSSISINFHSGIKINIYDGTNRLLLAAELKDGVLHQLKSETECSFTRSKDSMLSFRVNENDHLINVYYDMPNSVIKSIVVRNENWMCIYQYQRAELTEIQRLRVLDGQPFGQGKVIYPH